MPSESREDRAAARQSGAALAQLAKRVRSRIVVAPPEEDAAVRSGTYRDQTIPYEAFSVYIAIEDYDRPPDPLPAEYAGASTVSGEDVLAEMFPGAQLAAARQIHKVVGILLEGGATVETLAHAAPPPPRPRPTTLDLVRYLNRRAPQLGFSATELTGKQQGRRSAANAPLREARARLVAEMVDSQNASLAQVGALLSCRPQSIQHLRDQGRKLRNERRDRGT